MLKKKTFVMSMFASEASLYKAKAEYYEAQAEKLQMELVVAQETVSHLEVTVLELARTKDQVLDHLEVSANLLTHLTS